MSSFSIVVAEDYGWMKVLNTEAGSNLEKFKARVADRFNVDAEEVDKVMEGIKNPADAYMIFKYGEMASKSSGEVMEKYKSKKNKGWGALAKSLGIKPGSDEFHELKKGHDMGNHETMEESKKKKEPKSKKKGKIKGKGKKKG